MVLTNYTKVAKGLTLFLAFSVLFSCEDPGKYFVNCNDCTADEPSEAYLKVKLEIKYGQSIVNVFMGNLEDSVLFDTFTANTAETNVKVPVNETFTLTTKYYYYNKYYYVVNSVTPRVVYEKNECNDPCYYVYDKVVDLRLKYTK
jgi:hypothetical protein